MQTPVIKPNAVINLASSGRFVMYKVGPVLAVNHGMGIGSASIMMNEILKLVHYCNLTNVKIIRMGSSGGLGVKPGTIIITDQAYDPLLQPFYTLIKVLVSLLELDYIISHLSD